MLRKITSTDLKQNTRKIVQEVVEKSEPAIVYTYNEPKILLIKYDPEYVQGRKVDLEKLKKYMFSAGKKINTAKMFRKMRDEK